jgi:hypothetical protein
VFLATIVTDSSTAYSHLAFAGDQIIVRGGLADVAVAVHRALAAGERRTLVVFEATTSRVVDLDLRGSEADVLQRLAAGANPAADAATDTDAPVRTGAPGRPRLGVVCREVSLLPRHWDWLKSQRGGASAALRRLVDDARKQSRGRDEIAALQEAIDRYLRVMAGDRPHYEDALRAFYADRETHLQGFVADWPADVRSHLDVLLRRYREARAA